MVHWLYLMLPSNWTCVQEARSMVWSQQWNLWQLYTPRPWRSYHHRAKEISSLNPYGESRLGSIGSQGISRLYVDSKKALSEVVHLPKKIEHGEIHAEYFIWRNLAFHSFFPGWELRWFLKGSKNRYQSWKKKKKNTICQHKGPSKNKTK